MSVVAHITIPFPVITAGSFDVVIKDTSTGSIVFTGTETNTPFDVSLPGGNYEMFTTYNGYENAWCFTLDDCSCIPYVSAIISESAPGVNFLVLTFNLDGWSFCPFLISYASAPNYISVNFISDLTHVSGTTYTYSIFIGAVTSIYFQIYKGLTAASGLCVGATVNYSCSPALLVDPFHPGDFQFRLVKVGSDWILKCKFFSCGASCHFFNLHYKQNYVMPGFTADEDTAIITLDCGDLSPWELDILLNPSPTFYSGCTLGFPNCMDYFIHIDDCCGNQVWPPNPISYFTTIGSL